MKKFNVDRLGYLNPQRFIMRDEVNIEHLNLAFVCGGQAGGKIGSEFVRLGYYATCYNTCKQDLDDFENIVKGIPDAKYNLIRLKGYDGASKNREMGLRAIQDNAELLEEKLIKDEQILNADFVWIVVALGGGTGNGSLATIAQIVSGYMRSNKRYAATYDDVGNVIDPGKPTVGVIAAIPDESSKHNIELNAAEALNEIKLLQDAGLVGACLLIDNSKLIHDYLEKSYDDVKNIDWVTYGNTTTAELISEIASIVCLPGRENFDKSEAIDIFSTPGFLNLGKRTLTVDWSKNYKNKDNQDISQATLIDELIKHTFEEQNVFADGYNFSTAMHGAMAILAPPSGKVLNIKHSLMMKQSLHKVLDSPTVGVTHYGFYTNTYYGTVRKALEQEEAYIYTMAVFKELPERVYSMAKKALQRKEKEIAELNKNNSNELNSMLNRLNNKTVNTKDVKLELNSIFNGNALKKIEKTHETTKKNNFLDPIDLIKRANGIKSGT